MRGWRHELGLTLVLLVFGLLLGIGSFVVLWYYFSVPYSR